MEIDPKMLEGGHMDFRNAGLRWYFGSTLRPLAPELAQKINCLARTLAGHESL